MTVYGQQSQLNRSPPRPRESVEKGQHKDVRFLRGLCCSGEPFGILHKQPLRFTIRVFSVSVHPSDHFALLAEEPVLDRGAVVVVAATR